MEMLYTGTIILLSTTTGLTCGLLLARHGERQRTKQRRFQHWVRS